MLISLPHVGAQAGSAVGGGLLDSFKAAVQQSSAQQSGGVGQQITQVDTGPKGDGSVGLFDGVLKKALLGGAMGVGVGLIPFLPGGPLIGGVLGALAGAGIGMVQNVRKIRQIQQENAAFLGAIGVQPQSQEEAQLMLSGNIKQLYEPGSTIQQGPPVQLPIAQTGSPTGVPQQAAQQSPPPAGPPAVHKPPTVVQPPTVLMPSKPSTPPTLPPVTPSLAQLPEMSMANVLEVDDFPRHLDTASPLVAESSGGGVNNAALAAWYDTEVAQRDKRIGEYWMQLTPSQRREAVVQRQLEQLRQHIAVLQQQLSALHPAAPPAAAGVSGGGMAPAPLAAACAGAACCT